MDVPKLIKFYLERHKSLIINFITEELGNNTEIPLDYKCQRPLFVRIGGDGFTTSQNISNTAIYVSILSQFCFDQNHVLLAALCSGGENYEKIGYMVEKVQEQFVKLQENERICMIAISINEELTVKIPLHFVQCSDYKFTCLLLGHSGAQSTYFCTHCFISKKELKDPNTDQNKYTEPHYQRSLDDMNGGRAGMCF